MKKLFLVTICTIFFSQFSIANNNEIEATELTGDTKTACEVILCLSSSTRPQECNAPIRKYYSIHAKKWHKTVAKRKAFLSLCPTKASKKEIDDLAKKGVNIDGQNEKMDDLKDAISDLPHECTAEALNKQLETRNYDDSIRIVKNLPSACAKLYAHDFTDIKVPKNSCNDRFYSKTDWNNGYENIYLGYGNQAKKEYEEWLFKGNKGHTKSKDIGNKHSRWVTEYYKHVTINKICWK